MFTGNKIALEYGKALAEACPASDMKKLLEEFEDFVSVMTRSQEWAEANGENDLGLFEILSHENLEAEAKRLIMADLAEKTGMSKILKDFMLLLIERKRFPIIFEALDVFRVKVFEDHGMVGVFIQAAREVSEESLNRVGALVERLTGRKAVFDVKVNPALLGGMEVRFEDTFLDMSVRGGLRSMKRAIAGQ